MGTFVIYRPLSLIDKGRQMAVVAKIPQDVGGRQRIKLDWYCAHGLGHLLLGTITLIRIYIEFFGVYSIEEQSLFENTDD